MAHAQNRYEGKQIGKQKDMKIVLIQKQYRKFWKRLERSYRIDEHGVAYDSNSTGFTKERKWTKDYSNRQLRHTKDIPMSKRGYQKTQYKANNFLYDYY